MNQEVKKKWLAALRSGEYKQGRSCLRKVDREEGERFCCLGVLCDLYREEKGLSKQEYWSQDQYQNYLAEGKSQAFLTTSVEKWSGLVGISPVLHPTPVEEISLVDMNDEGKDFNFIADKINLYL